MAQTFFLCAFAGYPLTVLQYNAQLSHKRPSHLISCCYGVHLCDPLQRLFTKVPSDNNVHPFPLSAEIRSRTRLDHHNDDVLNGSCPFDRALSFTIPQLPRPATSCRDEKSAKLTSIHRLSQFQLISHIYIPVHPEHVANATTYDNKHITIRITR